MLQTIHIEVCWHNYEEVRTLPLMLELGRYRRPKVPHSERTCTICSDEVEDEPSWMPSIGEREKAPT